MKTRTRQDPRPVIYAAFDGLFAASYLVIILKVAPPLKGAGSMFWLLVVLFGGMSILSLIRTPWARRAVVGACACLLVFEVVLLGLIISSAAFLSGVFGSFGTGGAGLALLVGVLSIQLVALLPALQMKFLMTRAGRLAYRARTRSEENAEPAT